MEEAWQDWLECDEEHAINDRASMNAGAGKYMNLIAIKAKKALNSIFNKQTPLS